MKTSLINEVSKVRQKIENSKLCFFSSKGSENNNYKKKLKKKVIKIILKYIHLKDNNCIY